MFSFPSVSPVIFKALKFALLAHDTHNQRRKYIGEPYIVHPLEVAETVDYWLPPYVVEYDRISVICAALNHDVIEDCGIMPHDMKKELGHEITELVLEVTDVSVPEDGNREARKKLDNEHLGKASDFGKYIKLADLKSNTKSIVEHDPKFAKVYLPEKYNTLMAIKPGIMEKSNLWFLWNEVYESCLKLQMDIRLNPDN